MTKNFRHIVFLTFALFILQGCDPLVNVSGTVVDTKGEALPGVGIAVKGAEYQAVSNGVGRYTLRIPPNPVVLEFVKTGYTPAEISVPIGGTGAVEVENALLWPLPGRKGVYLFEGYRYRDCTHAETRRYMRIELKDGKEVVVDSPPLFAVKRKPDTKTRSTFFEVGARGETPMLIAHKLPPYDVELNRLEEREAAIFVPRANRGAKASDNDLPRDKVWAAAENIPVSATPIDQPERMLLDLRPAYPLEAGIYAIHWGAFSGYNAIDPRIFLFEVVEESTEVEVLSGEDGEGENTEEEDDVIIPELPPTPDVSVTGGEF